MLKILYGILTAPLSLPFNPIVNYLICIIVGEGVFQLPYCYSRKFGAFLENRLVLRWFIRILFYLAIWAIIYVAATKGEFLEQYWYSIALAVVVVHILAIVFIFYYKGLREKESEEEE